MTEENGDARVPNAAGEGGKAVNGDIDPSGRFGLDEDHRELLEQADRRGGDTNGSVSFEQVSAGLYLSRSNLRFLSDMKLRAEREPCIMLGVLLDGHAHLRIGDTDCEMAGGEFSALLFNEPTTTLSSISGGSRLNMAGIVAEPDWLERNGFGDLMRDGTGLDRLNLPHARAGRFETPGSLRSIATTLMSLGEDTGAISKLRREALTLEFFAESMANLHGLGGQANSGTVSPRALRRMHQVRDQLAHWPPDKKLTLELAARHVGMSASTLARHFRAAFGTTVIAFVAERRMDAAMRAMVDRGATIAEASHIAGFSSPANFSTAFRRRFRMSPKAFLSRR